MSLSELKQTHNNVAFYRSFATTYKLNFFVGRKTETILVRTFVQEVREKLGEFGKQYGTYFSILDQIAHGDVTQSEIEGALDHILWHCPGTVVPSEDDGKLSIQADWRLVATEWCQLQG